MKSPVPENTKKILAGLNPQLRDRLVELRQLILETASEDPSIGPLEETLKWGEPAFLTNATKAGTTIRINRHAKDDRKYAIYVHCQTDLVDRYRQLYGGLLAFDGSRAVVFDIDKALPIKAVKHCIAMALTYHLKD